MSEGIADTSIFIARESGPAIDVATLPDRIGISVIAVGELRAGVLAASDVATRDRRLSTAALALDPLPIDTRVAEAWARLRVLLRQAGARMPVSDSWIAATAIAHEVPVVTQDDDYAVVEGLVIIRV